MQHDQRGSSGYAGRDSGRPEGEQDDRDAWGEYPGQFGGDYDDAERRFGPRSPQRAAPRRGYAGPDRRRSFRGRGPRGYTRSDERIREDVCDRLTDEDVDVSDVEVRVAKGEVTLSGSVPDRATKRDVEDITEHVAGVTDIANELNVRLQNERRDTKKANEGERPKAE